MAEPIMLSALQHYSYCPRQCALIHQEQSFDDNEYTLRGQRAHRRVDSGEISTEDGRRVLRALPLYSDRLGLVGKADAVEFLPDGTPYPVEYKQGKRHKYDHDDIQLAAQALCLEEMTGCVVSEGAIYHHKSKRRRTMPACAVPALCTISANRNLSDPGIVSMTCPSIYSKWTSPRSETTAQHALRFHGRGLAQA